MTERDWTAGVRPDVLESIDRPREWIAVQPRRHDDDGRVYLAYFRVDLTLGFVWDGNIEHPVQVTREMGEDVIDTFHLPDVGFMPYAEMFALFKRSCDQFTTTFHED